MEPPDATPLVSVIEKAGLEMQPGIPVFKLVVGSLFDIFLCRYRSIGVFQTSLHCV